MTSFYSLSTGIIDASPYLSMDYHKKGVIMKLPDKTEFYASGTKESHNGVIIIPDYSGWDNGRVRNICDFFGDHNCFAVIPNFSAKGHTGEFKSLTESSGLRDWLKSYTFEGNIKPVLQSLIKLMKDEGVTRICLLGYSWGGWVACHVLASEMTSDFLCAALVHPSIDLEEKVYGGTVLELMCAVNRPVLLMPCSSCSESYCSMVKLLKYKLPTSDIIDYRHLPSSFLMQANEKDEMMKQNLTKCLNELVNFFSFHFHANPKSLVREGDFLAADSAEKYQMGLIPKIVEETKMIVEETKNYAKMMTDATFSTLENWGVIGHAPENDENLNRNVNNAGNAGNDALRRYSDQGLGKKSTMDDVSKNTLKPGATKSYAGVVREQPLQAQLKPRKSLPFQPQK